MKLFDDFKSFLLEDQFSLHVYQNKVNIVNYETIGHFDSNIVKVNIPNGEVIVKGKNLVVSKLMQKEILILGTIQSIEFR